jgi:hypothetical protein
MSKTPVSATPTATGVTVPPEMWKQIQKMLATYHEPISTGTPAELSTSSASRGISLPLPTPELPLRTLSEDKEDDCQEPIGNDLTCEYDQSIPDDVRDPLPKAPIGDDQASKNGTVEPNQNKSYIANLNSYDFSIGGELSSSSIMSFCILHSFIC